MFAFLPIFAVFASSSTQWDNGNAVMLDQNKIVETSASSSLTNSMPHGSWSIKAIAVHLKFVFLPPLLELGSNENVHHWNGKILLYLISSLDSTSDIKSWEVGGDDVAAEVLGCNFLHFQLANWDVWHAGQMGAEFVLTFPQVDTRWSSWVGAFSVIVKTDC